MDVEECWQSPPFDGMEKTYPECFIWWECLGDPTLNSLMEYTAKQNLDLSIAASRILEARTEQKGATADKLPHLDGSLTYGHAQFNQKTLNHILGRSCCDKKRHSKTRQIDLFEVGFDAEWEIDLFGMGRHAAKALQAKADAVEADFYQIWVTLSAEVAKNYIELRGLQSKLHIMDTHIQAQQDTLHLMQILTQTGFNNFIDQQQAQTQLHSLMAQRPQIEMAIQKAMHRLAILSGYQPGDLSEELSQATPLPYLPCEEPLGIPSELLRRRPDILKAEKELAAATEQVGVAIAALFPRLSLQGFIGDISAFCSGGLTWFAGSQFLMPIFNSKLLQQDVKINKLKAQQALFNYQKTVLEALEEAENGIATLHYELKRKQDLALAEQSAREAYQLTWQLYEQGFKDYFEVLNAQKLILEAENTMQQSQIDLLTSYIALYKALGGGWDIFCALE
jgi:NodT family efflux transporter outer membrane factor (OMF) lipoprotein